MQDGGISPSGGSQGIEKSNDRANRAKSDASPCFGLFAKNRTKGVTTNCPTAQKATIFQIPRHGLGSSCLKNESNDVVNFTIDKSFCLPNSEIPWEPTAALYDF